MRGKNTLSPFLLMNEKSELLFFVPVQEHREPVFAFTKKIFSGVPEEERKKIISRIEYIYFGLSRETAQFVLTGSFPPLALKSALVQKNGWEKISAAINNKDVLYYRNNSQNIEVFTGIPNIIIASENVLSMLNALYTMPLEPSGLSNFPSWAAKDIKAFTSNDIFFYIASFSSMIESMFRVNFPADGAISRASAEGRLSKTAAKEYVLSLDIDFKDRRAVTPALMILSLSGLFSNAKITTGEGAHVLITNVVPPELITNMFL
jgi:hypothetical protein